MKTAKVQGYPATFDVAIPIDVELPKFEYGCEVRGKLLVEAMLDQKIDAGHHWYGDFVVEGVEVIEIPSGGSKYFYTEIWHLGS